jgi:ubiquinone/menaquinone biosynthesis C-methylase UbiE
VSEHRAPPIEHALHAINAHWVTSALAAAVTHRVFEFLEQGPAVVHDVAVGCNIAERGARALLDALVGADLVVQSDGRYENTAIASSYFVEGKPLYLGQLARLSLQLMTRSGGFPDAIAAGHSEGSLSVKADMPQWAQLVLATAPFSLPVAYLAAKLLGLAERRSLEILDPGGGAGVFAISFLKENPRATATQLDWPSVNRVAREQAERNEVLDRFRTVDGDLFAYDYESAKYDLIIFSHMAHGLAPADNQRAFVLFRRALKPQGVLLINELLAELDGSVSPQALLSSARTFYATRDGAGYRYAEYREWLNAAGFRSIARHDTGTPTTLLVVQVD